MPPNRHTHPRHATTTRRHRDRGALAGLAPLRGLAARVRARLLVLACAEGGYTSEAVIWTALAVIAAATVAGLILPALIGKAHEIVNQLR